MANKKIESALRKIAKNNGVSEAEVRREIELAIEDARENPDPGIQAFWKGVPRKGDKPTVEDVIAHIAETIDKA